jgi:telomere length regulation protein
MVLQVGLSNRELLSPIKEVPKTTEKVKSEISAKLDVKRENITAQDVPQIWKNQPGHELLHEVLQYTTSDEAKRQGLSIAVPSPLSSQVINSLLDYTLPDYWALFQQARQHEEDKRQLLQCLQSVSGIGAIISKLRMLCNHFHGKSSNPEGTTGNGRMRDLLSVLEEVLKGQRTIQDVWLQIHSSIQSATRRTILWKEFIVIVASGKIPSTAAEVEDALKASGGAVPNHWIANGKEYAHWLGSNISFFISQTGPGYDEESWVALGKFLSKSLKLGYTGQWCRSCWSDLSSADV